MTNQVVINDVRVFINDVGVFINDVDVVINDVRVSREPLVHKAFKRFQFPYR